MTVRYVNCRGIDNKTLAETDGSFYATPGCRIVSAMTFPFGAKVVEVAEITTGTCPSCGLDKQTLHAGICDRCRVKREVGS